MRLYIRNKATLLQNQAVQDRSNQTDSNDLSGTDRCSNMPSGSSPSLPGKGGAQMMVRSSVLKGAAFNTFLPDDGSQEGIVGSGQDIRAATIAVACRVPADVITTLGQWKSQTYLIYVKLPSSQLSDISRKLASTDI